MSNEQQAHTLDAALTLLDRFVLRVSIELRDTDPGLLTHPAWKGLIDEANALLKDRPQGISADLSPVAQPLKQLIRLAAEDIERELIRLGGMARSVVFNANSIENIIRKHLTARTAEQWTSDPPTVDGVYWWRLSENDPDPDICETDLQYGFVYDIGDPVGRSVKELDGEWLGPIGPSSTILPRVDRTPQFQVTPVHPFGQCGYKYCDWPDGELRCNEPRAALLHPPSEFETKQ